MGAARVTRSAPGEYLRKGASKTVLPAPGNFSYGDSAKKPGVPRRSEQPVHGLTTSKNFITSNAIENILSGALFSASPRCFSCSENLPRCSASNVLTIVLVVRRAAEAEGVWQRSVPVQEGVRGGAAVPAEDEGAPQRHDGVAPAAGIRAPSLPCPLALAQQLCERNGSGSEENRSREPCLFFAEWLVADSVSVCCVRTGSRRSRIASSCSAAMSAATSSASSRRSGTA